MGRIINPYKYDTVEQPKEVYEYDEYIKVYDYVQEKKHKHKAISDAEKIINGEDEKAYLIMLLLGSMCWLIWVMLGDMEM